MRITKIMIEMPHEGERQRLTWLRQVLREIGIFAVYIGIDRSYLTNLFKNEIGISPQEYLVSYRMDMAAGMLKETDKKIQEIA